MPIVAKTFLNIITETRVLLAESDPGQFFDNTFIKAWINNENINIFNKIVQAFQDYFCTGSRTALSQGVTKYSLRSLPMGWQKIRFVSRIQASGREIPIFPMNIDNEVSFNSANVVRTGKPSNYTIKGQLMELWPSPDTNETLRVQYIFQPPLLVNDTDVSIIPEQYHELLVYGAAIRARIRDEEKLKDFRDQYAILYEQMINSIQEVQIQSPRWVDNLEDVDDGIGYDGISWDS